MKASNLIIELQGLIDKYGDQPMKCWDNDCSVLIRCIAPYTLSGHDPDCQDHDEECAEFHVLPSHK